MSEQNDNFLDNACGTAIGLSRNKRKAELANERDHNLTKETESSGPPELFTRKNRKYKVWDAKVPGGYARIREFHPDEGGPNYYEAFISTRRGLIECGRSVEPSCLRKSVEQHIDYEKQIINSGSIRYSIPDLVWVKK